MNIPEAFIDVDFAQQPSYFPGDLGPPPSDAFADYEEAMGTIPQSDWKNVIESLEAEKAGAEYLVYHIYNQGRVGSCTSNATCQAMLMAANRQFGVEKSPILSPISLYKRVARGPSSGSTIKDNVDIAIDEGVLPADIENNRGRFPHVMHPSDWSARFPEGWERTAAWFRLGEVYICRSLEAVVSALLRQHPVIVGRQGHAVVYVRPTYDRRGRLLVTYANSWGNWGFAMGYLPYGFGADSIDLIQRASYWAVAVRTVEYANEGLTR